jgi:hypothetical protein
MSSKSLRARVRGFLKLDSSNARSQQESLLPSSSDALDGDMALALALSVSETQSRPSKQEEEDAKLAWELSEKSLDTKSDELLARALQEEEEAAAALSRCALTADHEPSTVAVSRLPGT